MTTPHTRHAGQVEILALTFLAIFIAVSAALTSYVVTGAHSEQVHAAQSGALALAEAGIDKAAVLLNTNGSYAGESDTPLGGGTFTITVTSIDSSTKEITATGYIPNSTDPTAERTVHAKVYINSSVVSFRYGVQVDQGGVTMGNNSQIVGNLYSNGSVSGSGTVTGDATVAAGAAPAVDQQWTTQNGGYNLSDVSARADLAQSFVPGVSTTLNKVSLYLKKVGVPGDITIKIVTDNSGKPSKTVLAFGTLPASAVTGSYGFSDASLSSSPSLTAGTTYWIIAIASVSASNYFVWGEDTADGYGSGTGKYSANWSAGSPTWTVVTGDLDFKTYMGGAITSLSGVTVGGNAYANTLSGCSISGDAYYQSISGCAVGGASHPGSPDQPSASLPISSAQITEWQSAAATGGTVGTQSFSSAVTSLGPKKIVGDLTLDNGSTLTLTGTLWVTGTFTASNNSIIKLDPSYGGNSGIIVVDTSATVSNNATFTGSGTAGSYVMVVVSKNDPTHDVLDINNNALGAVFTAPYGRVHFNNNGGAKEVTGYGFDIDNNATVTYDTGLESETFSNGPGGSWTFVPGSYGIKP